MQRKKTFNLNLEFADIAKEVVMNNIPYETPVEEIFKAMSAHLNNQYDIVMIKRKTCPVYLTVKEKFIGEYLAQGFMCEITNSFKKQEKFTEGENGKPFLFYVYYKRKYQ